MIKRSTDLSKKEFELIQSFIFKKVGIFLGESKIFLIKNRLFKRLKILNIESYHDYYRYMQIHKEEQMVMINLITTNETYFFRENTHFDFFLNDIVTKFKYNDENSKLRIWSAASSVGAEAYTIAMLLHDSIKYYEIIGTDINSDVIQKANIGLYPLKWMDKIPNDFKKKFCLIGKGKHEGWFLVDRVLLNNMSFSIKNLLFPQEDLGMFDVVFLKNVLIYFDKLTKEKIIKNVLENLKLGGYLYISLTEHIHDLNINNLKQVHTSIFQKVA